MSRGRLPGDTTSEALHGSLDLLLNNRFGAFATRRPNDTEMVGDQRKRLCPDLAQQVYMVRHL